MKIAYCHSQVYLTTHWYSIKYLGGAATVKFVRGPCHHGTRRDGIKQLSFSNANLGGPSDNALRKVQSGYTPFSGVFKGLLEAFLLTKQNITET